ncbi:ABC transporter permease [Bombella sp. TMW 2.2543]|uniref:ABC transporter permease n=1 Tax=Bombella pluederhausensis TaxID=2967336 RepID=A0ABT3WF82_9PROT|nr:ABC transporter permease [Bombella pluederhausensis]MCX5617626.1 ABC transporter permease [Bombella pluederhausensis]
MHLSKDVDFLQRSSRSAERHANLSLFQAFCTQVRVIFALIMRETLTRYGRENIGFLWVVGEPILFCGGVAVVWTAVRPSHEHGLQMTAMVITGYIPLTMFRHALSRSTKAYEVNSSLLFHKLVTPLDIIFARTTLEVLGVLIAAIIITFGAIILGYMAPPVDWSFTYAGLFFVIFFSYGVSFIFAYLTERSDTLEKAVGVINYLSLPWTGAFVMIDWLPPQYRWILEDTSPLANAIELMRSGVFGSKVVAHYSLMYLFYTCGITFLIGLYLTLKIRPHINMS